MTQQNIADDESEQITTETIADVVDAHGAYVLDEVMVSGGSDDDYPTVTFSASTGNSADLEDGEQLMAIDYNPSKEMYGIWTGEADGANRWDVTNKIDENYDLQLAVLDAILSFDDVSNLLD